jgi:hypothetical protein
MVNAMKILSFKPSLALLRNSLILITFFIPGLSFAYGGSHYGYRHYGYSSHYSRHHYGGHSYYPGKYFRRHSYSYYPNRNYQYYPKSYSLAVPTNIKVYVDNNSNQYGNSEHTGVNSSAWQTLKQGQYGQALTIFANEAQSNPNSGVPKAGYALATASKGNLDRGIWAMRRAFRIDPDSLHYLQFDEKGHGVIDNLIDQYSSQENKTNVGQAFMVSALHYLKHDYVAAKKAIASAKQYGDKSTSLANLQRLVNQQ